jgi:hypothetical protein
MRQFLFAILAAVLAVQPARIVVLDGPRLVDGTGRPPLENARIVIDGDRIVAAGAADVVAAPGGAERIDLSGIAAAISSFRRRSFASIRRPPGWSGPRRRVSRSRRRRGS